LQPLGQQRVPSGPGIATLIVQLVQPLRQALGITSQLARRGMTNLLDPPLATPTRLSLPACRALAELGVPAPVGDICPTAAGAEPTCRAYPLFIKAKAAKATLAYLLERLVAARAATWRLIAAVL
jgi:hypothetical protein